VTHPAHPDNLILLCVACHTRFDHDFPKWVFFPSDTILQTYVDHEKEDYERRTQMAFTGLSKPRTLPNIHTHTATYVPYVLDPEMIGGQPDSFFQLPIPRPWRGHPSAAILKSVVGGFAPSTMGVVNNAHGHSFCVGIPYTTLSLVAELCQLWSRPDPTPRNTMSIPLQAVTVANAPLTKQSDNSKSNALPEKGFAQGALGQGNTLVTGPSAGGSKTYDSSPALTATSLESLPEEFHLFGPEFSTNNIVDTFLK
jgi:hypothetical protein